MNLSGVWEGHRLAPRMVSLGFPFSQNDIYLQVGLLSPHFSEPYNSERNYIFSSKARVLSNPVA